MMRRARHIAVALGLATALASVGAQAQAQRDPTLPPPGAVASGNGTDAVPAPDLPWGDEGIAVVKRGGKPYVVSGTRLYGAGQKIGDYKIERISETQIWLRKGSELRKLPLFAGIERKVSNPKVSSP
jgi:hypothetical protein